MRRILIALFLAACSGELDGAPGDDDALDAAPGLPGADATPGQPQPDAGPPIGPQPGDGVDFTAYPKQRDETDSSWGTVLTDIAQHTPPEYGDYYWSNDLVTAAHETTHGINADIRNDYNDTGARANGFYVLEGRAVLVVEPDIRKSHVAPYVPEVLRGFRFDTYITGQTEWDDTPLYVWDEWVAYTNGGEVAVDLVESGLWSYGWRDGVAGQLEFTVYALAVGMAVKERDPAYFAANTQFREFLAWNARRAMDVYRRGAVMEEFAWDDQDQFYTDLRTNAEAEEIREFARETFGEAWAVEVLGL